MNEDMRGKCHVVVQRPSDTWAKTVGEPRVQVDPTPLTCPSCHRRECMLLTQVDVENEYLIGGKGVAIYVRCTGCGYQPSEMSARTI
jgi:hypothetical protein